MANGASSLLNFTGCFGINKCRIIPDNQEFVYKYYCMTSTRRDVLSRFFNSSVFPAVSPFMTKMQQEKYIGCSLLHESPHACHLKCLGTGLRFCPVCRQETDSLFLRIHQVPGMAICPKHHIPLMEACGFTDDMRHPFESVSVVKRSYSESAAERFSNFVLQILTLRQNYNIYDLLDTIYLLMQFRGWNSDSLLNEISKYGFTGSLSCTPDVFRETIFQQHNYLHPLDYMILSCCLFENATEMNQAVTSKIENDYLQLKNILI